MRRIIALGVLLLLAGCSNGGADDAADPDDPLITADTYYEVAGVGNFATMPHSDLDSIGKAMCSDMRGLDHDEERRNVWLVLNEQADTELQSLGMTLAITARHCPEYFHLWDDEVEEIMDGELPW